LEQLKLEIPIQYLLGKTSFYGLDFEVDSSVLIPRPETEELVEWILESQKSKVKSQKLRILDIGTGSGCIAISLAKNISEAQVFAIDVSEKALATAKKNAEKNKVELTLIAQNILRTDDLGQQFDIIVSNPPYVRNLEKQEIKKNVLDNEPHLALFVEDGDALMFYRKIAGLAQKNLAPNGQLFFEINQYLAKETLALLTEMGFKNIELRKDIYGNDRMIKATVQ
jgi:release factor glutamine methyltransferase